MRAQSLQSICGGDSIRWSMAHQLARSAFICLIGILSCGAAASAQEANGGGAMKARPLDRIPAGSVVFDTKQRGFSDLILFVKGQLSAGDTDAVNDRTRYYGDLFNLVYAANVVRGEKGFQLEKISVGFSTKIKGQDTIVTSETEKELGVGLNLIGRSVLSGNEKALEDIQLVAQNATCAVVDAPSVMYYQNKHQKMLVRFFIWVSTADGKLGTTVWLLGSDGKKLAFAEPTFNYLAPEFVEERVLHVDGSRFTLGIPSADAFALVSIPKGRSYPVTDRLRETGAATSFTAESLRELASSLAEAMNQK